MALMGAPRPSTSRRLRLGYFEDLTTRVLVAGIDKGVGSAGTRRGSVSEVRGWLEAGDVDIALLPAWDFLHIDRLEMIPGVCLTTHGAGNIMLLCSKVLPTEIKSVLVDNESFGARSLAEILLPSQTGSHPECQRSNQPLDPSKLNFAAMPHDAFLLVGDNALRVKRSAFAWVWDLGAAWQSATDTPLVVHVWCCRKGTVLRGVDDEIVSTCRQNQKTIADIAAKEGERFRTNPTVLEKLLVGVFRYDAGPSQFSALRLYLRELMKARMMDKPRQFTIYTEASSTSSVRIPKL